MPTNFYPLTSRILDSLGYRPVTVAAEDSKIRVTLNSANGQKAILTIGEAEGLHSRLRLAIEAARANRDEAEAAAKTARYSDPDIIALYEAAMGERTFDVENEFDRLAYDRIKAAQLKAKTFAPGGVVYGSNESSGGRW